MINIPHYLMPEIRVWMQFAFELGYAWDGPGLEAVATKTLERLSTKYATATEHPLRQAATNLLDFQICESKLLHNFKFLYQIKKYFNASEIMLGID